MNKKEKVEKVVNHLLEGADYRDVYAWARKYLINYLSKPQNEVELEEEFEFLQEMESEENE